MDCQYREGSSPCLPPLNFGTTSSNGDQDREATALQLQPSHSVSIAELTKDRYGPLRSVNSSAVPHIKTPILEQLFPGTQTSITYTFFHVENQGSKESPPRLSSSNFPRTAQLEKIEDLITSSAQAQPNNFGANYDGDLIHQQPSKFTFFPRLPPELRLRVWQFTTFPRIVSFVPGGGKAPAPLSVCRESRKETRKLYRLSIHICPRGRHVVRARAQRPRNVRIPDFGVFINYDVDIIYLAPSRNFCDWNIIDDVNNVQLERNDDCLCIATLRFPLWLMPAQRIAFELHNPQPLSTRNYDDESLRWKCHFADLAEDCPLLEEILLLEHHETQLTPQRLLDTAFHSETGDSSFEQASEAIEDAETYAENEQAVVRDLKTEEECAKQIMGAPKPDYDNIFARYWWSKNPKLTFVKLEK
ncbi:uncharacterized protein K444DRAFT_185595 [Hyaloscypha bicolor E]|uniref:2EXR domain-containing protein n=1 Tax=Hyaloscypha bicolor E TaxID=1095630 RepID=A0A2J6TRX0_9HELO|nr:uncharacterized protein K444DRAFT_185595 [Hyaloscypha bicolor E]PMD65718.1 hypothetical protein K444DRAFT_185595 [Hyaloscypha bicolor E]